MPRCELSISAILERHKAFWSMEHVEKPLLRISQYKKTEFERPPSKMSLPLADGSMASEDVFYLEPEMSL